MKDAEQAHAAALSHGARSILSPVTLTDPTTGQQQTVAEVVLYGDVVLRLVSGPYEVCQEAHQQLTRQEHFCRTGGRTDTLFPTHRVL